ncbi:Wzy polymerase domain-containing protein [Psychromonas sp. PT13]|uniref:PglL family O-oligosaccharyltransferase n=1 Tax=Psychromonas sp. PT13 TaxID=3439547 RepID=UPI003EB9000B
MDVQQKLTRAFFITFTLLMAVGAHYFQHNQGGSGLELAQNNVVWIFFSILIGLGLWKITEQKKIIYSRFTIVFLIAVVLFFIPLFYPNNELASQSYTRLLGLLAGFLFYVSLQQFQFNKAQLQRLLLLIVLAGFIQSCYSLMQDYLLTEGNIFGYAVSYGRPYGIFQQPNVLASFLVTTLVLSGYLLQQISSRKLQFFLLLTAMINAWVITITISRVGYLGALIAIALFTPWAWKQDKKKLLTFLLIVFIGIGIAALKPNFFDVKSGHVENITQDNGRVIKYTNSLIMVKNKPLMGYGYGSFEKNYLIIQAERVKNNEIPPAGEGILTHPHNDILYWAIEGGIVPILALLLLVVCFIHLLSNFKISKALLLSAFVLPISLHTQTEYPLYHSSLHWLVLLFLVFYVDSQTKKIKEANLQLTFALRIFALLIPLVTTIFMVTNLYAMYKITKFERSKQPDINLLLDIVNPLVFEDKFTFHLNYFRLSMAIQRHKPEEIQAIINETEEIIEEKPRPYFYIILYIAYSNSGQKEQADTVLEYARYLFPRDSQIANINKQPTKSTSPALETNIEKP